MYIHVTGKGRTSPWTMADKGRADVFRITRYDMYAEPGANLDIGVSIDDWFGRYAPGQSSIKAVCRIVGLKEGNGRFFPIIVPVLPIQVFQAFGIDSPTNGIMLFTGRITAALESRRYAISPDEFSSVVNQKTGHGPIDHMAVLVDLVEYLLKKGMPVDDIITATKRPAVGPEDTCTFGPKTILGDALDPDSFAGRTYFIDIKWSNGETQLATAADVVNLYRAGRFDSGIVMDELSGGLVVFRRGGR